MPRLRHFFPALALLAILPLASCQSSSSKSQVLGLEATDVTPFIDIPVPLAFKQEYDPLFFIQYKTYKGPRAALMHYTGGSDLLAVVQFYHDFLPPEGWKFIKQETGPASIYLYYSKPDETLIVTVYAVPQNTSIILKVVPGSAFGPSSNVTVSDTPPPGP